MLINRRWVPTEGDGAHSQLLHQVKLLGEELLYRLNVARLLDEFVDFPLIEVEFEAIVDNFFGVRAPICKHRPFFDERFGLLLNPENLVV